MVSNRVAFAALALACIAAAAGGGYVATRQSVPVAAAPAASTSAVAEPAAAPSPAPAPTVPAAAAQPVRAATAAAATPAKGREVASRPAPRAVEPGEPGVRASGAPASEPVSAPQPAAAQIPASESPAASPADVRAAAEPVPAAEPPQPAFEELVVSADSVVGLQLGTTVTSDDARVEDAVEARVIRDVRVGRTVAIPAGSRAQGSVVAVERGGKFRERARLGIRFHTLVLADGSRLPITTDTIYRYGDAPGDRSAKKIGGGAVAGAILGAIIGGGKGAAVGATAGAGGGTAMVMAGDRSPAEFPSGTEVTARFLAPVTVTIDR